MAPIDPSKAFPTIGVAASAADADLKPWSFERHSVGENDILIDVKFCGVCHSDCHVAKNDMGNSLYPCVPGHEAAGVVSAVGSKVTKFAVGDHAGVGCFVDSCLDCGRCSDGDEQYCEKGMTLTYGSKSTHGRAGPEGSITYGGYSKHMVVHEHFGVKLPSDYPLEAAGPLMCAAITLWDPLVHWKAGPGSRVAILGVGGLGMMGIKLAKALGCEVTAITSTPSKVDVCKEMGASRVIVSSDGESVKAATKSLDLILNTISATHDVTKYIDLLDVNGTIVQLGLVTEPHSVNQLPLIFCRRGIAGSVIGGIKNTESCVAFCSKHKIKPEIEIVSCDKINEVYEKLMTKNDMVKRYVLDIANTL